MSRPDEFAQPPSYEEAMRGHDSYAGASAPFLSSPEKDTKPVPGHHAMVPAAPVTPAVPMGPVSPMPSGTQAAQSGSGQAPAPMIVMPTTVYITTPPLGPKPVNMTCPLCHKQIRTSTTVTNTGTAHAVCVLMCLFGCWFCSCIPYCLSGFKITKHKCPSCKAYLGCYKP